jgi:hypothetical protein
MAKVFARSPDDFEDLVPHVACIASDRITVDGAPVGYMSRDRTDGMWNFFAGDEDEDYTADPGNFEIYSVNTIANYDRAILAYLDELPGSAWFRFKGIFIRDPQGAPEPE